MQNEYTLNQIRHFVSNNYPSVAARMVKSLLQHYDELNGAAQELVHLHACEQEGLSSGKPTPQQWFDAVNKLSNKIYDRDKG